MRRSRDPSGRYPAVIKADGLAAGKGVIIADRRGAGARSARRLLVEHRFGTDRVVVEERLIGEELSLLALCDGVRALPLAPPRTTSASSTATRVPTPVAWAPTRRCPAIERAAMRSELVGQVHQPVVDELMRGAGRRSTACSTPA